MFAGEDAQRKGKNSTKSKRGFDGSWDSGQDDGGSEEGQPSLWNTRYPHS